MDKHYINRLMHLRDEEFDLQTQLTISRLIDKYPYFSLLYIYKAKSIKSLRNQNLNDSLHLASVYVPDRLKLKEIIQTNTPVLEPQAAKASPNKKLQEINNKIEELRKAYNVENIKPQIHDIIQEIDSYTEPDLSDNPTKAELIERFLQIENPKVNNIKNNASENVSIVDVVKGSVKDEFKIVTETMANIYLKQGHKDKAIKIYRQLILVNPEKSVYFANQIQKIEENN